MIETGYRHFRPPKRTSKSVLHQSFSFHFITILLQFIGRNTYRYFFLLSKSFLQAFKFILNVFKLIGKLALNGFILVVRLISFFGQLKQKASQAIKTLFWYRYRFILAGLFVFITFSSLSFYFIILKDLPSPHQLTDRDQVVATKIYDRNHRLLYTIFDGDHKRTLVVLDEIPEHLIQATIAIEDQDFWQHPGFSLRGILRAVNRNFSQQTVQGGSTITQQLVKNALLTSERTLTRKIKEVLLAVQVELIFPKQEILQMYFNEIPYGGTAYGIEEAAQTYFGKPTTDLSLAEAALLAGLPVAPTKLSPFGANPQLAFARQYQVLQQMVENGYITQKQAQEAYKAPLDFKPQAENIKAPHFVMYVKDILVEKYGTKRVEQGGLEVVTSIDLELQELVEKKAREELSQLTALNVTNGAVLVTKPATGEILAMVGSKDYFDLENDGNVNIITSLQQPGSAIKPVNYAVALQSGFTPSSIILDSPVIYQVAGSPPYAPINYDKRFHGPITLRTALGSSYNVPAVKVLAKVGISKMIDMAETMGITTWQDRSRYGLSLTLGGGEVRMTDMAVVYGSLANQGLRVNLHPILRVKDYNSKILQDFACDPQFTLLPQVEAAEEQLYCNPQSVLSPLIAYQLTDILSDNNARTPAFGPNSLLKISNHQVAVKTGTTNDKRDNWTIGYTKDYVIVVWVGNNDNSPMSAVTSGITGASPIWQQVMKSLLEEKGEPHLFSPPSGLKAVEICSLNGLLPCEGCPTKTEYFLPGTEPKVHCRMKPEEDQEERDKILTGASTETQ